MVGLFVHIVSVLLITQVTSQNDRHILVALSFRNRSNKRKQWCSDEVLHVDEWLDNPHDDNLVRHTSICHVSRILIS